MMTGESSSTTKDPRHQALTAYLGPLLQKHEKGDTITYEDLLSSKQAANSITKEETATKVIEELHTSQMAAYQTAATAALQQWATDQFTLPPAQSDESWSDYRQRWWTAALSALPAWKVDTKESIIKPILQGKALALYNAKRRETEAAQKKSDENTDTAAVVGSTPDKNISKTNKSDESEKIEEGEEEEEEKEEGEEEEEDDGEVEKEEEEEEEGEMEEDEDGEVSNEKTAAAPPQKQPQANKAKTNKSTAAAGATKQAPKKKNQASKPKRGTARRGRGRGRGGANSAK